MAVSASLNAGVSGLTANANKLSTISDNIANASTYGYKRVETDFDSVVTGTNGGNYAAGGVRATTQRLVDQRASLVSTRNSTDLAVRGRGLLPVASAVEFKATGADQMYLTTTGSFRADAEGYLRTESGLMLLGWPARSDGTIPPQPRDTAEGLEPIRLNSNQLSGAPTTRMTMGVNLPASETAAGASGDTREFSIEYFDNLGNSQQMMVEFAPNIPASGASNTWRMSLLDQATGGSVIGEYELTFSDSRTDGGSLADVRVISGGAYNTDSGKIIVDVEGGPIEINLGRYGVGDGLTQLSDNFVPTSITKDGSRVGNMTGVEVNSNGFVEAQFDTGVSRVIYQVPLVDLPNPNGMISLDTQTFRPSSESGAFFLWDAGSGPTGAVQSYAREESATDIAAELTDMIKTQRNYSSNAKVIQTVDEMLQETTNIKR